MNLHGAKIKVTDKNNNCTDCQMCKAAEKWEHAIMYDKNRQIRGEWIKNSKEKFKVIIKKLQAT